MLQTQPRIHKVPGTAGVGATVAGSQFQNGCPGCFFGCAVSPEAHRIITDRRVFHTYAKGEYVFHSGEDAHGIWAVCTGRIKVFQETEEGKQLTVRIAGPGAIVGHRSLLAGTPLSAYGVTLEESHTAYLAADVVQHLINTDEAVRAGVIHRLADDLGHAETLATSMAYHHAEERLRGALLELAARSSTGPTELLAPRQELAELAGLTVEATVRTLRRLEHHGLIESRGRRIYIPDRAALQDPH